jgi:hypothetical protein
MSYLTAVERAVWAAWNTQPKGEAAPVKRIAADLGMTAADVAFVVYPAETFGRWDDTQEPDLQRQRVWSEQSLWHPDHGQPDESGYVRAQLPVGVVCVGCGQFLDGTAVAGDTITNTVLYRHGVEVTRHYVCDSCHCYLDGEDD